MADTQVRRAVYEIPVNIFDGPSAFGIPARNWIEASIFSFIPGALFWNFFNFGDISIKIILVSIICIPVAVMSLIGYNGESLTQFLRTYLRFRKNRRILEYRIEDEDDGEVRGPFDALEKEINEVQALLKDTNDKALKKELKEKLKGLQKELKAEKAKHLKEAKEEEKQVADALAAKKKEEEEHADALAEEEIQRRIEAGESLDKKQRKAIQEEFRKKYVLSIPKAPEKDDGIQRNISSQEYLPIDRIEDRCIITKGGRFIRILGVVPVNFPMMAAEQQNYIINQFGLLLRTCPVNIQLKTMAKSADVEGFIEAMQERMATEPNEKCRALMQDYINTLRSNATRNGVTRQFFLILEYDEEQATRNTTDKQRKLALENAVTRAKQQLKTCGNVVYEFEDEQEEVDFIYNALFSQLERFNAFGMKYSDKVDYTYNQAAAYPNRKLTAADFIAPLHIDMTNSKYVVVDGVYYGYMYIPSNGYRSLVYGSWLFGPINAGGGIDIDIFISRGDRDKVRSASRRQINLSSGMMHGQNSNTDSFDQLKRKADSANYIKNGLSQGQDFFTVTTIVTVIAMSENALFDRMRELSQIFDDMDMKCVAANYHQEDAFLGTLPLCKVPESIFALGHRNMLTSGAASIYPFASYELMDDNGILMGLNLSNGSLVMPDVFDTSRYKNPHMFIVGSSGAGKTYNMLVQALHTRLSGIQTFVIAPLKGREFRRSCEAIGGQFIRIAPGSPHNINVMEIRKNDERSAMVARILDNDDGEESILSEKISSLETLFEIMVPDITNEEAQLLNGHMVSTYRKFGITDDNRSLIDPDNPDKYRKMPTLRDLSEDMAKDDRMTRIRNIMSKYVTGSAHNFSEPTNISLDNKYTVIDLSAFEKNKKMLPIAMYIALDLIDDKVKEDRTKNKRVFIDEIWRLVGKGAPEAAAQSVLEMFKTFRGLGCGVVAVTQELSDFFALDNGSYAQAILNACSLGMVMATEPVALNLLRNSLSLEQNEIEMIQGLERGQALLIGNGSSVAIKIIASRLEHELITTDVHEMNAMVEERMKEMADELDSSAEPSEDLTPGELITASRRASQNLDSVGHRKVKL